MDPIDPLTHLVERGLAFFQWLLTFPQQGYRNLVRNSIGMWSDMTLVGYVRMIAIVGAYLFLRPYLQQYGERVQKKRFEEAAAAAAAAGGADGADGAGGANVFREGEGAKKAGAKIVKFEEEKEGDEKGEGGEEWGKKAKRRQKAAEKVAEEKMRLEQEENGDRDIFAHLVDYEEGKDGW